jgi:hypothetical protein
VYTTGHRRYVAPGIPVFASSFDLANAIKAMRRDLTLAGAPLVGRLSCGAGGAQADGPLPYQPLAPASYGRLFVIDIADGRVLRIGSAAACRRAAAAIEAPTSATASAGLAPGPTASSGLRAAARGA